MKINGFLEDNREILCISDDTMYDTQLNYVGFNSIVEEIKPNLKARGLPTQLQVPTAAQSLFTKS